MEDFVPINDAKINKKGSIRGTIIKMSELKSGTTNKGVDWTRKDCEIEDKSGSVKLTIWKDDIDKFKLGYVYEIVNPQWKMHDEVVQVQPSQYGSFQCVGAAETAQAVQSTEAPTPEPPKKAPTTKQVKTKIPQLEASVAQIIRANTLLMIQIEKEVKATLRDLLDEEPRGDKIGMYTRMNFYFLKGMDVKD